jgi:DNA-binding CsgD family transcriptional regulator
VRKAARDIRDADYRRFCFLRGGIAERVMLFDSAFPTVSVSGFRALARGPMSPGVAEPLQEAGPVIVAALRRHHELLESGSQGGAQAPSRAALLERAREWGLSAREAEVAVGLATGHSQEQIAGHMGLALSSVITYRRRAYVKLQVANRGELRALFGRATGQGAPVTDSLLT